MQLGTISKDVAFATIKKQLDANDYDTAEFKIRIGKKSKTVKWNDFEFMMGVHDITEKLKLEYQNTHNYNKALEKLSFEYFTEIKSQKE